MSKVAEIHYDGQVYEMPVIEGSENEKAIDISSLRAKSGLITIDQGFKNTGSTTSAITFLHWFVRLPLFTLNRSTQTGRGTK